jgi:thioredoxin-like negative regulator of GroEL
MSPSVEETASRFADDVEFVPVDVSTDRVTAARYMVYGVPSLVAVASGKVLGRTMGSATQEQLDSFFAGARDRDVARSRLTTGERALRLGVAAAIAGIGLASAQPVVVVGALGFVAYAFLDHLPRFRR